jgi:hypothetical protein
MQVEAAFCRRPEGTDADQDRRGVRGDAADACDLDRHRSPGNGAAEVLDTVHGHRVDVQRREGRPVRVHHERGACTVEQVADRHGRTEAVVHR